MDDIIESINKAITNRIEFYAYRLPGGKQVVFNAAPIRDCQLILEGFKIVPFNSYGGKFQSVEIPKQLGVADFLHYDAIKNATADNSHFQSTPFDDYAESFIHIVNKIESGVLQKAVLSKVTTVECGQINVGDYFIRLEKCHKDAFVFIYYTPIYGTWIGATPETLARYHNHQLHTMALAGTKLRNRVWHNKEIAEQNFVTRYIEQIFDANKLSYKESNTRTVPAGNIDHLCTEFIADIKSRSTAENIVSVLHPTPATCGIPLKEALQTITSVEKHQRICYGGYVGPFNDKGFDYFVNLRSMYFDGIRCHIFSGGGITIDSQLNDEWKETQFKASILSGLFN